MTDFALAELATPRASTTPVAPLWQVVVGQNNIGPQYELSLAKQRQLTFQVDDSSGFSFNLNGADPATQYIQELVTDAWVYRNGILINRYRIGSSQDVVDGEADTYDITFNCFDYKEWLARQLLYPGRVWSWRNVPQSKIVSDLVTLVINGQSGIHPVVTVDTSKLPTSTVNFDTTVGTSIKEVLGVMPGFGWQVIPNSTMGITIKCISPWWYALNNHFVLNYGGTVKKITRGLDTGAFGNSAVYTGSMNLVPVQRDASGIGTALQGRLAITGSDPSIVDNAHLAQAAQNFATNSQNVVPSWACDLAAGAWTSPTDAWLGDICQFVVNKGRLNVNAQYRIIKVQININDDSPTGDAVSLTIAQPPYVPSS